MFFNLVKLAGSNATERPSPATCKANSTHSFELMSINVSLTSYSWTVTETVRRVAMLRGDAACVLRTVELAANKPDADCIYSGDILF